jgi:hypothetical protein
MTPQRTDSFVPLTAAPAPPERREFNVSVIQNGAAPKNFQSLTMPPSAPAAPLAAKKSCEPRVSVQRDGNRVTHLRIQCTCGEVLDLACLYDEAASAA